MAYEESETGVSQIMIVTQTTAVKHKLLTYR